MLSAKKSVPEMPSVKDQSPRDSLSPLDQHFKDEDNNNNNNRKNSTQSRNASPATSSTREAQTEQEPHITFLETDQFHAVATPVLSTSPPEQACSPRSPLIFRPHRPTDLRLTRSNGLTTITTNELKRQITTASCGDGHTGTDCCATRTQVPRPKPSTKKRLPKTPFAIAPARDPDPPIAMGNAHSSELEHADTASLNSVVRKPMRVLRKSSTNLFKRIDSKSPLPRPLTATSILVTTKGLRPHTDGCNDDDDDDGESPIDPFMDPAYSAREPVILHSASTMTVTEDDTFGQPLSASTTTVKEGNRSPYRVTVDDDDDDDAESDFDDGLPPPVPAHRSSALSPTIPAPSPLPEDSPHKYGLKDRMDTPELAQEPPEDINVMKARRRSSGLEIFNEAKSLQSAQSFLNGLSTLRRRAESTNRSGTDTTYATAHTSSTTRPTSRPGSRPGSAMHLPSHPSSHTSQHQPTATPLPPPPQAGPGQNDNDGRRRGHNFKSTGFAYSRALSLTQLKCYRKHSRLLKSSNGKAPVECAVCHMDDEQEHWVCSWCAVRMCRYCRRAFGEGGVTALRGRVREAETGGGGGSGFGGVNAREGSSSAESLVVVGGRGGRGRAFV